MRVGVLCEICLVATFHLQLAAAAFAPPRQEQATIQVQDAAGHVRRSIAAQPRHATGDLRRRGHPAHRQVLRSFRDGGFVNEFAFAGGVRPTGVHGIHADMFR